MPNCLAGAGDRRFLLTFRSPVITLGSSPVSLQDQEHVLCCGKRLGSGVSAEAIPGDGRDRMRSADLWATDRTGSRSRFSGRCSALSAAFGLTEVDGWRDQV